MHELIVKVSNVEPELPPEQQNALFGDGLLITAVDAPTSIDDILIDDRLLEDSEYHIDRPQSGLVRVAVLGDWTNAGMVSAKINLQERQRKLPRPFASGKLVDEEIDSYTVNIDKRTTQLNFELSWKADWGHYPTYDIDLIVFDPTGAPYFEGATLDSPERFSIDSPESGQWTILVTGYMLYGFEDKYVLRITDQDNRALWRRGRKHKHD